MFLTSDELVALTGFKRPSAQVRWLAHKRGDCSMRASHYLLPLA